MLVCCTSSRCQICNILLNLTLNSLSKFGSNTEQSEVSLVSSSSVVQSALAELLVLLVVLGHFMMTYCYE